MKYYAKIHTAFWASPTVRAFSDDGRLLALYLLTCPHSTLAGVYRLPSGYACEDLLWGTERFIKALSELFSNGFATRCNVTNWVWVHKHFDWNPLENPNQRKAAAKIAAQIPDDCVWRPDFMRICRRFFDPDTPPEAEPFGNPSETVPKPVAVTVDATVDVTTPPTPAREPAKPTDWKFAMSMNWRPSENFQTLARMAGLGAASESAIGEFIAYWISQPAMLRTQHVWEHALIKSMKSDRARGSARAQATPVRQLESFAERDRRHARERWEQMTGRRHPDSDRLAPGGSGIVIDAEPVLQQKRIGGVEEF